MKQKFVAGALASAVVFLTTMAASASTLLSDGDFAGTIDVLSHSGDPLGTATGAVCGGSCGNPGSALQATLNYGGSSAVGSTLADVGFIDHSLGYDPLTLGSISTISASYDRALRTTFPFSQALNFRLVIQQNGIDYVTAVIVPGGPDTAGLIWHNLAASNLIASDFSSIDFTTGIGGSAHPNFAGDPMLFGVEAVTLMRGGQETFAFFDNIDITVNQTPLPAALPLFGTGLGALGLLGWRRKRKRVLIAH